MTILILGSEGFIGSHLIQFFSNKNWNVYGADLFEVGTRPYHYHKISRLSPEYEEILQFTRFDLCINAAGSGNVPYSVSHPMIDFEANVLDTIRILDGLRKFQPACRYLHISSAAVYGNPVTLPIAEESTPQPISPYGWHKLMAENICREYSSVYKMKTAIVRPFSVYGPGLKKQLFWDLYIKCKETPNRIINLWGNGNESRDFIYIDDLIKAFEAVVDKSPFEGEVYNVASGTETLVADAARIFTTQYDSAIRIDFSHAERSGDPQNWAADVAKLKRLGFQNEKTLKEGIIRVVKWMKNLN